MSVAANWTRRQPQRSLRRGGLSRGGGGAGCALRYLRARENGSRGSCRQLGTRFMDERLAAACGLRHTELLGHFGCVNAIEFSSQGNFLLSGGDDRRVLLWNLEEAILKAKGPTCMRSEHMSNIFCLAFDNVPSKIFSAGNDDMVIVHDMHTGQAVEVFPHDQPVYGLSVDPLNDNIFASACDDGHILMYDIREPPATDPFCLASYATSFHAVMFNPVEPRLLASANSKEGIGLWDVRQPQKVVLRYGQAKSGPQSSMSVRFDSMGRRLLGLRRRLPPVLFSIQSPAPLCEFHHPGYHNSCTMKSCCFAGHSDQYVLSGSDDFNLYVWKVPPQELEVKCVEKAHLVLSGHRSIVNQVRFNQSNCIIASSGVEKLVKLWSPFNISWPEGEDSPRSSEKLRPLYTHEDYINLVLRSGQFMSHDYSNHSTKEDPRMMAFFDSLVQREIEGWSSEDSMSSEDSASDSEDLGQRTPVQASPVDPSNSEKGNSGHPNNGATQQAQEAHGGQGQSVSLQQFEPDDPAIRDLVEHLFPHPPPSPPSLPSPVDLVSCVAPDQNLCSEPGSLSRRNSPGTQSTARCIDFPIVAYEYSSDSSEDDELSAQELAHNDLVGGNLATEMAPGRHSVVISHAQEHVDPKADSD